MTVGPLMTRAAQRTVYRLGMLRPLIVAVLAVVFLAVAPTMAQADRAATPRERAAMLRAFLSPDADVAFARYVRVHAKASVSTVNRQYGLLEWRGTRTVQGAGVLMRKQPRKPWRELPIYLPTDTHCGDYMERVYMDLLRSCWATSTRFPRVLPAPSATSLRCAEPWHGRTYLYVLRNLAPGRMTCEQLGEALYGDDWHRTARMTPWGVQVYSRYDGRHVIALVDEPAEQSVGHGRGAWPWMGDVRAAPPLTLHATKRVARAAAKLRGATEVSAVSGCAKTGTYTANCRVVNWWAGDAVFKGRSTVRLQHRNGKAVGFTGRWTGTLFNDYAGTSEPHSYRWTVTMRQLQQS